MRTLARWGRPTVPWPATASTSSSVIDTPTSARRSTINVARRTRRLASSSRSARNAGCRDVDEVAQDVMLAPLDAGAEFHAWHDLDPDVLAGVDRFLHAVDRVVIGQRERGQAAPGRLADEVGRGEQAVGYGAVGVQVDAVRHRCVRSLPAPNYRGSTTSRIAVRSSFSMVTSMKAGRQIASMPVSRR